MSRVRTRIATSDASSITVRGRDLTKEIMGQKTFSELIYFLSTSRMPTPEQTRVLDVCLVSLAEHGWTPTSMITRLAADSVPDQIQLAMAAGLLTVGPVFAGTMEGCAAILEKGVASGEAPASFAERVAREHTEAKRPLPGFGHRLHKPDDPRSGVILSVVREAGLAGRYVELLDALAEAADRVRGRHITLNATGAIAAALLEIGLPAHAMRGIAVISRAAGLLGHVIEERESGAAREIWRLTRENIPYEDPETGA